MLALQALRARFRNHMASQRSLFEGRMLQRSSRSASYRSPGARSPATVRHWLVGAGGNSLAVCLAASLEACFALKPAPILSPLQVVASYDLASPRAMPPAAPTAAAGAAAPAAAPTVLPAAALPEGPPPGFRPKLGYYCFEFRWRVRQVRICWLVQLGSGRLAGGGLVEH